jgi:hypothetical protein
MTYSVENFGSDTEHIKELLNAIPPQILKDLIMKSKNIIKMNSWRRPQKLNHDEICAIYLDEIYKQKNISLAIHLDKKINSILSDANVSDILEGITDTTEDLFAAGCQIEEMLILKKINLSAELVITLSGKKFSKEVRNALSCLHKTFISIREPKKEELGETKAALLQIEKSLSEAHKQKEVADKQIKALKKICTTEQAKCNNQENSLIEFQSQLADAESKNKLLSQKTTELQLNLKSLQSALDKAEKLPDITELLRTADGQTAIKAFLLKNEAETNSIFADLIEKHCEISEKFMQTAEKTWVAENENKLRKAQNNLFLANNELNRTIASLTEKKEEQKSLKSKTDALILKKASLEKEISEMEQHLATVSAEAETAQMVASTANSVSFVTELYRPGQKVDENPDKVSNTEAIVSILKNNLKCVGVGTEYREILASYLCAAVRERIPLILAGPNGRDIADALSITLCNKTAAHLCCAGEWNEELVGRTISGENDLVIAIDNPLDSRWIGQLLPTVQNKKHVFILLIPIAEELSIEPAGLYDYMLPVLTSYFVTEDLSVDWIGGIADESLLLYRSKGKSGARYPKLSPIAKRHANAVLSNAIEICKNQGGLLKYLCQILPLALNLCANDWMIEDIGKDTALTENDKVALLELCGADTK